jgi:hypothetical protein
LEGTVLKLAKSLRIHVSSLIWDLTAEVLCRGNKMVGTLAGNSIKWGRTETYIK